MKKDTKIFIAGHTGLVGSACVRKLREAGFGNLVLRTSAELDLRDQSRVNVFFQSEKPEMVILAAARVGGIMANATRPAEYLYDNLQIASNVIHAAAGVDVRKLINLGSSCIYPRDTVQPIREDALLTGPLEPTNEAYAVAKIAALKLCGAMHRQYGCDFFSIMPPNLYGPGDRFDLAGSHVLPALMRKFHLAQLLARGELRENEPERLADHGIHPGHIVLWGTGTPMREFLHADDLASAILILLNHGTAAEIGESINVGSGEEIRIHDLAEMMAEIAGYHGEITWDARYPDGTPRKILDSSRMEKFEWKPKITLRDGIREIYRWYINVRKEKP